MCDHADVDALAQLLTKSLEDEEWSKSLIRLPEVLTNTLFKRMCCQYRQSVRTMQLTLMATKCTGRNWNRNEFYQYLK
jgi:hypothetical protein